MLALLHPGLAAMPYDVESKRLTREHIRERLEALGGPITDDELRPASVVGTPASVPAGPSSLGLGVARRRGYDIPPHAETILERGREGLDALQDSVVRRAYGRVIRAAEHSLVKEGHAPGSAGFSPSKVLALSLFAQ